MHLYPTVLVRPLNGSRFYVFVVQGHGHGEGVPHTADGDWVGEVALPCPALWVSKHAIQVRPRAYERAQRRERFKAVTSRALTSWTNA